MHIDLIKICIILVISFFIIYLVIKTFNIREGLTNDDGSTSTTDTTTTSTSLGEAGNASNYASTIKALTVQLQDQILISKYRTDYENVIINLEDYINMLMLKQVLNMDTTTKTIANLTTLNTLFSAKKSLNDVMLYIDKQ